MNNAVLKIFLFCVIWLPVAVIISFIPGIYVLMSYIGMISVGYMLGRLVDFIITKLGE